MRVRELIAAILVIIPAASAIAETPTVFGLRLGSSLDLPRCERRGRNDSICWESTYAHPDHGESFSNGEVMIKFPTSEAPSIVSGAAMVGQMIDGKLEGVRFNTRGIHNSDDVLEQLKTKYGAPSKLVPRVLTNGAGVSHNIFDATWKTGGVVVVYLSATKTIDVGFIGIHTIKAIEEMRQSGELKNKRPL